MTPFEMRTNTPEPHSSDVCAKCGQIWDDHCGCQCPNEKGSFTPLKSNAQPDIEAMECANEITHLTWHGSAMFREKLVPIISRYLTKARGEGANARAITTEELKVIYSRKASDGPCFYCERPTNSLAGDPGQWPLHFSLEDGIAKVFHVECVTERLFCKEHIHECAVKAAHEVAREYSIPFNHYHDATPLLVHIICKAFGAPAKDECEEAAEAAWQSYVKKLDLICNATEAKNLCHVFKTAWKLAKEKK